MYETWQSTNVNHLVKLLFTKPHPEDWFNLTPSKHITSAWISDWNHRPNGRKFPLVWCAERVRTTQDFIKPLETVGSNGGYLCSISMHSLSYRTTFTNVLCYGAFRFYLPVSLRPAVLAPAIRPLLNRSVSIALSSANVTLRWCLAGSVSRPCLSFGWFGPALIDLGFLRRVDGLCGNRTL